MGRNLDDLIVALQFIKYFTLKILHLVYFMKHFFKNLLVKMLDHPIQQILSKFCAIHYQHFM